MSYIYRVRQFVRAAGASRHADAVDQALARRYLPPAATVMFCSMPGYDRQHACNVVQTLQEWGQDDPDLLAAALLHDVGKTMASGVRLRLWHRVVVVLMRRLGSGVLGWVAEERPTSWRWPFYVQQHHAAIGAELAKQAGCSQRTVEWIRRHEDVPGDTDDRSLAALQAADGVN